MNAIISLLYLALFAKSVIASDYNPSSLTKFNVFVKTPRSKEYINTGGRLIERHVDYVAQAGYKGFLSIVEFATNDTIFNGVPGSFPSTQYEMSLAESYGMKATYVVSSLTVESAKQISDIIDSLPKPLFLHCHVGYTASLFTLLHLYLKKELHTAQELYTEGLTLGYDYQSNEGVVTLFNSITGAKDTVQPEKIEQTLANGESSYKSYFWLHRMGNNDYWYNTGEILSTHINAIGSAGYRSIVTFRASGEPTARLPTDPSTGPIPNDEFSDENGNYQVALEQGAVDAYNTQATHPIKLYSLPISSSSTNNPWTVERFFQYLPSLQEAASRGPVVNHCASGYRSGAMTLTYLAYTEHRCSTWVFTYAKQIGFDYTSDAQIVSFVHAVLGC